jgi:hypothetical protein
MLSASGPRRLRTIGIPETPRCRRANAGEEPRWPGPPVGPKASDPLDRQQDRRPKVPRPKGTQ